MTIGRDSTLDPAPRSHKPTAGPIQRQPRGRASVPEPNALAALAGTSSQAAA